jgi:cell division protein ZapA
MRDAITTVSVKILDKEYQVSCPEEEVDALTSSARFLDQQMRQIRESGKVFGLDRIAVMAALNLANELLQKRNAVDEVKREADSVLQPADRTGRQCSGRAPPARIVTARPSRVVRPLSILGTACGFAILRPSPGMFASR